MKCLEKTELLIKNNWAASYYDFTIAKAKSTIKKITIDPSGLMSNVKQANNVNEVK
ncbi:MAG: hypothetical protein ACI9WT_000029 [Flavobacterium sp.]|jgi:hypothetical protein